jgi:hypothetical protein
MKTIDTHPLIKNTWGVLLETYKKEGLNEDVKAFVTVVAEGYPFPTNLDRRVPETTGMAPKSEQDVVIKCLQIHLTKKYILSQLQRMRDDSKA